MAQNEDNPWQEVNLSCLEAELEASSESTPPRMEIYTTRLSQRQHCQGFGTGTIRPRTLWSRTFRPRTIRLRTLFPDVFTSPYVSSLNESQPKELRQPWIGWAFSLT
jgi:hypothetical protein